MHQTHRLYTVTSQRTPAGETHPLAKLTELQVQQVHELHSQGLSLGAIAARFGVKKPCIWKIVTGHRRGHSMLAMLAKKPVSSPALERKVAATPETDAKVLHGLTALEVMTLLELSRTWSVARLAEHFDIPRDQVRLVIKADAAERNELLPTRRVCRDPLPQLPAPVDVDTGVRAMQLLAHTVMS